MADTIIADTYKDKVFKKSMIAQRQAEQLVDLLQKGDFKSIQKNINDVQRLMTYYRCAILEVETKFNVLDEQLSLLYERNPIDSITSRLKSPKSIYEKIIRKNLPAEVSSIEGNINDVAGVRVICTFEDDIYMLADAFLGQDDVRLICRKDYIESPKPNGYRSLHLIVEVPIFLVGEKRMMKVEVQLRTIAMELWANLEHRIYYKKDIDGETARKAASDLTRCAVMCADLDRKMQSIRNYIDKKE